MSDLSRFWLLPNASAQEYGIRGDELIYIIHIFMALLFIGWGIFFLYCLVRYRARAGGRGEYEPVGTKTTKTLEVAVVIFEGFLLLGLSIPAWGEFKRELEPDVDATRLRVVAHQFQWEFHYAGPDGQYGKTSVKNFSGTNPLGLTETPGDPPSYDDVYSAGIMVVPVGKPVAVEVTSLDVIHGFAVPELRVKQDAVPGMKIPVWFHPIKIGEYDIVCSQLCGNSHYRMGGKVRVVSQADYDAWVAEQVKSRKDSLGLPSAPTPAEPAPAAAPAPPPAAPAAQPAH